ncbi:MAG TPA: Sec-independent protein translocase protein TatB [Wenzhouxiangellaceae bacterium]|nr:Sec-independent protein translocase protein TatB [Wenzhouxiangellaceae bacterium]
MGGAGFTEMLLLAVIALIVVGPHRLPKIARTAGRLTRQARNAWQGLQSELQAELDADHNRKIMEATQTRANPPESSDDSSEAQSSAAKAGKNGTQDEPADRN